MPSPTITLIYPRYRLLKEFVETKISLRLGGLHVKICVWDTSCFLIKSKFGKKLLNIQKVLNILKKGIDCSCQGTACWTFKSGWRPKCWMFSNELNVHAKTQHVEHSILFEHSEKQNLLNIQWRSQHWTPSTSILCCIAKVIPGNLSHLEWAEHMERLIKEATMKLLQCKKARRMLKQAKGKVLSILKKGTLMNIHTNSMEKWTKF